MNDPLPSAAAPSAPPSKDAAHLDLIGVFYYVLAAIAALFSLFPLIHVTMGAAMISGAFDQPGNGAPPQIVGWLFLVMGAIFILVGMAFAASMALAGRRLRQRRSYTLCLVLAALSCMFMPFGTVIGVLALVLLVKPEVKAMFAPA
ncbi:hypothetical protein J5226_23410 [Lysobacter sp. K5869]|uniref:hypothetical protein n=1 Tax=Lysobacter sp. K5869 TaxID=2820808 RepID=UPI001C061D91|nr:hypothetical protein [Lysobacter sp. K5869]QWP76493.1 hypothetical protein J5226_23410 [Lysobacter sp. K5869]